MEKTYGGAKRFSKDGNGTAARNETLESFIRDAGDKAYRFAYDLSGNSDEARELVQETCYRLARSWKSFQPSRPVSSWFFTVLRNAFLDSRRRFERRKVVSLDLPLEDEDGASFEGIIPDGAEGIPESLERVETAQTVRRAMRGLTREHRAVLELCDMGGMAYEEVARSLGVSVGTVRSRIFWARAALRGQLAAS